MPWAAAVLVVAIGLTVIVVGMLTPVSFGWSAYQPLSDAAFIGDASGVFVSRTTVIGAAILALGLMVIAFLAGYRARGRTAR